MKSAWIFASAFGALSLSVFGQAGAVPAQYSFTISDFQIWTDTGVDFAAGDSLSIAAETKTGSDRNCNPGGFQVIAGNPGAIPLPAAPPGALIAKTSEKADPMLVGNKGDLKFDAAGHLFLGVNQNATSNCAFAVKAQITHTQAAASSGDADGNTGTAGVAPRSASQGSTNAAAHTDLKTQLSSAAQVWLKGQFGSSPSSGGKESASAVSNNATASATATASTGVKLPTVILDADLRQHIDGLPRRVHDHAGNLGDMINFVIVGSQERVQAALDAADWHVADLDSKEAGLKAVLDTYQKKEYLQMPMSHLYLFDRMQDFGYEQAQAFAVVATRHHFRIWKAPFTWNNEVVWVGAATHDIGFEKDIRTGKLTHKIDPDIDLERTNLAEGLERSGKAKDITYYLAPNPIQEAKNASGGSYHSDGRLLVVFLK
ncbi:MAG: hypothetical protein DMG93_17485 [Acidobacteria bacterium]|nr:MAG: hypothetical protein DMG93_17485 [Acidobacteriota bacterium]